MKTLAALLRTRDRYLILSHARPDGDTLGSAAALCALLRALGKTAFVAPNPEITPRYLPFLQPWLETEDYAYHTVLTVDTASRALLPARYRDLQVDIRIDHHPNTLPYAAHEYTEPGAAACGEVIYKLARELALPITPQIAAPLYLALSTDTGCFRYANTTADSHRIAAALIDTGFDRFALDELVFMSRSRAQVAVESAVLRDMDYLAGGRVALALLPRALLEKSGAGEDDLDGFSSLPLGVEGVFVGITVREETAGCKLSVRSAKPYAANRICAELGGGGHERAAGANLALPPDKTRAAVLAALYRLYPELED